MIEYNVGDHVLVTCKSRGTMSWGRCWKTCPRQGKAVVTEANRGRTSDVKTEYWIDGVLECKGGFHGDEFVLLEDVQDRPLHLTPLDGMAT